MRQKTFQRLPEAEQGLLRGQYELMCDYSAALAERIKNFGQSTAKAEG